MATDVTGTKGALEPHSERERLLLFHARSSIEAGVFDHEQVIREWGRRWGGIQPTRGTELTWHDEGGGVVGVYVRMTSATDFDKLDRIGWVNPQLRHLRSRFRDEHKVRARWPDIRRVIASLAAFYLSKSGGGTREREAAWDLLAEHVEGVSIESMGDYHELLARIRQDFGPLTAAEAAAESA